MKISITGVTGFRNRGVEALVQPILSELASRYRNPEILVYSGSPDYDKHRIKNPLVKCFPEGGEEMVRGRMGRRLVRFGIECGKIAYPGWDGLQESDLLIVTGGDVFSSEYGDYSFNRHLIPMRLAKKSGIPFVILAQSIGPFTSEQHRDWFLEVARYASGISVREERTWNYLTQVLRLPENLVIQVADPAFLLQPAPNIFQCGNGCNRSANPVVAVSISQAIFEWVGDEREKRTSVWAGLCKRMIDEWGASILMIPHVQEAYANDNLACSDVWRSMGFNTKVRICGEDLTASEYKGIIGDCEMVVAERMHAGIAGLSSLVCTSIIAYSVKARGVMDQMVGREHAERGALIEGSDFSDIEIVWRKLNATWQCREAIREKLRQTVPSEQLQSRKAFEILPDVSLVLQ